MSVILQSSTTQKLHGGLTKTLLASTKNDVKVFYFEIPLVKIFSFHNVTWNFSGAPVYSLNLSNPSKFSTLQMCKTFQRNGNFCNTLYGRDFSGWCCLRLIDLAKKFHLMTLIGLGRLTYRGHLFPDDDLRVLAKKASYTTSFATNLST